MFTDFEGMLFGGNQKRKGKPGGIYYPPGEVVTASLSSSPCGRGRVGVFDLFDCERGSANGCSV